MKNILILLFFITIVGCTDWNEKKEESKGHHVPKRPRVINFVDAGFQVNLKKVDNYTYGSRITWNNPQGVSVQVVRQSQGETQTIFTSSSSNAEYIDTGCPYDSDVYYYLVQTGTDNKSFQQGLRIPQIVIESEEDFNFDVQFQEYEWNKFKVNVSWQIPFNGEFELVKYLIDRDTSEHNLIEKIPVTSWQGVYEGDEVETGKHYKYKILYRGLRKFEGELPLTKIVEIPNRIKKLTIEGIVRVSDLKGFEEYTHLDLKKDAVLIVEDKNINLNLRELKSEGASVITFLEDSTAPSDEKGKDGGNIFIRTLYAVGKLHIILRGQNADKRTDEPPALGEAGRGTRGGNGVGGADKCYSEPSEGEGRRLRPRIRCYCASQPTSGGQGGQGVQGRQGYQGYAGGNTGIAEIIIESGNNFELNYERFTGLGGIGSRGGLGGPGGHGGSAGGSTRHCGNASNGPQGPQGARGNQGLDGNNGETGKICLKLSADSVKYCF